MKHPIALSPFHLNLVKTILKNNLPHHAVVWLFGSRATNQAKPYSDVDLAIDIGQPLSLEILTKLSNGFEESTLPFKVDIVDWHSISDSFQKKIAEHRICLLESRD